MKRYKQREIKAMIRSGEATDLTKLREDGLRKIWKTESGLTEIGYSAGIYGCNGKLLKGNRSGNLYGVSDRTLALWLVS